MKVVINITTDTTAELLHQLEIVSKFIENKACQVIKENCPEKIEFVGMDFDNDCRCAVTKIDFYNFKIIE